MFRLFILSVLIFSAFISFGQDDLDIQIKQLEVDLDALKKEENRNLQKIEDLKLKRIRRDIQLLGLPKVEEGKLLVNHSAMTICYDDDYNQARWVAHVITPDIVQGNTSRTNDFRKDSLIFKDTPDKNDYWNSGFDRGHLAPSADFRWSRRALSESYFYSNMSPQRPELNRERWAELEDKLRKYVADNKEQIYVVTGGVLKPGLPTMGEHKISIPELFYKVALDYSGDTKKAIGFIMPNGKCEYPVFHYAVSIDSVEKITGIDFFPNLPDQEEAKLEATCDYKLWLSDKEKDDVLPLDPKTLPKKTFNTIQAKVLIGEEATVCGTVVATKYHEKTGGTFINLDQKFPNQIFSVTIWKADRVNFSYSPEKELLGRKVCIHGKVDSYKGVPSITIQNEKAIKFLDDDDD